MDDLKQSVQNAVYEQKDPLLIYKFESFELFKQMLDKVNKDIVSFLYKGVIPVQDPNQVREARAPQRTDMSKLRANKAEATRQNINPNGLPASAQAEQPRERLQPVRVEQKIGRNDPCPCGSGKKYKNCHGAGQV
jgi:preprotein translocase subunit SecA